VTGAARYRRHDGTHWRPAHLQRVQRAPGGPGRFTVELVDTTTGNTRTLAVPRWQVEARHPALGLVPIDVWADSTAELFPVN
jgi:hypothetical protein